MNTTLLTALKQYPAVKLKASAVKVASKAHLLRYLNDKSPNDIIIMSQVESAIRLLIADGYCERVQGNENLIRFLKFDPIIVHKAVAPIPKPVVPIEQTKQFLKYEPKKKNQWTSMIEQIVLGLVKQKLNNQEITEYLKTKHDFEIAHKRLAWRILMMRRAGLLKETSRNNPKTYWTEKEVGDLLRLREMGFTFPIIASMLTELFKREITYCAVTAKYREHKKALAKKSISLVENCAFNPSQFTRTDAEYSGLMGATNTLTSPNQNDKVSINNGY